MKKIILSIILLTGFGFAKGSVVCPDCAEFEKLSKAEQHKIIKKDFKIIRQLFKDLDVIIDSIKTTQKEIQKMRKDLKNSDGSCDALDLIKLDLDAFESELSKIGNKNGSKYKEINREYHKQKKVYDREKIKYSCKK